jgi:hypothetical protein
VTSAAKQLVTKLEDLKSHLGKLAILYRLKLALVDFVRRFKPALVDFVQGFKLLWWISFLLPLSRERFIVS